MDLSDPVRIRTNVLLSGADLTMSLEEARALKLTFSEDAEHAGPIIEHYATPGIPHGQLIRLDESGEATFYPLDYPIYAA